MKNRKDAVFASGESACELSLSSSRRNSKLETLVGTGILLVLAITAVGVFQKQSRYDHALFKVAVEEGQIAPEGPSQEGSSYDSLIPLSERLKPLTPVEIFEPDTLSDKINGKAELYLSAGFAGLRSQRFAKENHPQLWLEILIYDMQNHRNAFSVYSTQMRSDAQKLDFATFAYRTSNAVFLVHGNEYMEIIASSEELQEEMLDLARSFTTSAAPEAEGLRELSMFPAEGLEVGSVSLHASNVFGFDRLDNTFTAKYSLQGQPVTAFLSFRENPEEATELASAYRQFLIENGGADQGRIDGVPGGILLQVFDTYECIFSHGRFLAGVHEAESRETAAEIAGLLYRELQRPANE